MLKRVIVWTPVAAVGLWAMVRVAGLEAGFPLVPLMAFTPYVAVLSFLPIVVALIARHRAATVAAVVVAAVFAVNVAPRAMGEARAEAAGGAALNVMTANLYFGHADADTVVAHVRDRQVDVLSVQELTPDAAGELDAAGLRELLPHAVLEPAWGAGGSGLYARHPLEEQPDRIRSSRMAQPVASVKVPGAAAVEVVAVHPTPPIPGMVSAWSEDLDALPGASHDGPLRILAGDFNATADHARFRRLLDSGYVDAADAAGVGLAPTWPTTRRRVPVPGVMIDHVLTDPRSAVTGAVVLDLPGSDHRAVVAALRLPADV